MIMCLQAQGKHKINSYRRVICYTQQQSLLSPFPILLIMAINELQSFCFTCNYNIYSEVFSLTISSDQNFCLKPRRTASELQGMDCNRNSKTDTSKNKVLCTDSQADSPCVSLRLCQGTESRFPGLFLVQKWTTL